MDFSQKRQPYNFGIKALKRQLIQGGMGKHDINKTIALYKFRVATKISEVKEKMEKEFEENKINASDK